MFSNNVFSHSEFFKSGLTKIKKLFIFLFASFFISLLNGCSEGDPTALYESLIVEFNDVQSIDLSVLNTVITTGDDLQLTVTGTNSTGTVDLTEYVSWTVSDDNLARVKSGGLLESFSTDGTVTVTASLSNFSDTEDITLSSASLDAIAIKADTATPDLLETAVCRPLVLKAFGTYSDMTVRDITNKVEWSTTTPSAILQTTPEVTLSYYDTPSANVFAELDGETSSQVDVIVNEDIDSMILSPTTGTLSTGDTLTFQVLAVYGSDTDVDISSTVDWDSSDTSKAAFNSNDEVLTGIAQGSTTVTATCGLQEETAQISVEGKTITSIEIEDQNNQAIELLAMKLNEIYQLSAYVHYSDDSKKEITEDATWSATHPAVGNPVVVTVSDTALEKGKVTSYAIENFDHVTIEYSGFNDLITVQVSP